jgi:hypothetical protein
MEEIIIELLAVILGAGPLFLALWHQNKKEKEEIEKGRQFIKRFCERVKNNNK